jgi:flagellar basal-body rod protein FlgC
MFAAMSIARSGLLASVARLDAAAANIANGRTSGPLPATLPSQPLPEATEGAPQVYQAVEVVLRSVGGDDAPSGVAATYRPRSPAYVRQYDPSAPYADRDGFVAAPNVDVAGEITDALAASVAFRANLAVLRTAGEMIKRLVDTSA